MGICKVIKRLFKRKYPTCRPDFIRWDIKPVPRRIIAIGDIHGDIEALGSILRRMDLADKLGNWIGGKTHLVLIGDLVGGHNSRLVIQFVMRFEKEARSAGGAVYALIGNHDIQMFDKRGAQEGKTLFEKYPVSGKKGDQVLKALSGHTDSARWLRTRNAIVKIGENIFTHAGLNDWALENSPGRVNATIRAWIRYWQGVGKRPDAKTDWVIAGKHRNPTLHVKSEGPIWTRAFKPGANRRKKEKSGRLDHATLFRILKKYRANNMTIGHTPVPGNKIILSHPYYGEMVIMIDTQISRDCGRLGCVEFIEGKPRAYYAKRDKSGERIGTLEMKRLEGSRKASALKKHRFLSNRKVYWL